jgi:hypothetical protein
MNRLLISFAVFATIYCFSPGADARELIKEFKGSESRNTTEFEVKAPWIVDWRVSGDYPGQMAVAVNLIDDVNGEYVGKVVTTKYVTNGVRLLDEGGRFHFEVNSSLANWTLRVIELTKQEAETYTPKEKIQ